jgi:hypothetical protein
VTAGVSVEGDVNRIEMIKRQMYGRAGFDRPCMVGDPHFPIATIPATILYNATSITASKCNSSKWTLFDTLLSPYPKERH